jgi:uncharacterized protein (TIGR03435 family)
VASVKASGPGSGRHARGGPGTSDPGQYRFDHASLLALISVAYHVDRFQVSSKTSLDQDFFDVAAKVPPGATREQFRSMLQNLLAERFHLKLHKESRDFPAFALTVAKGGSKMRASAVNPAAESATGPFQASAEGFLEIPPGRSGMASRYSLDGGFIVIRVTGQSQTAAILASALQAGLQSAPGPDNGTPVVDRTGLNGTYDFHLEYSLELPAVTGADPKLPPVPDVFAAVTRQLGLQLVRKKLPFDYLVIESFARTPVEN